MRCFKRFQSQICVNVILFVFKPSMIESTRMSKLVIPFHNVIGFQHVTIVPVIVILGGEWGKIDMTGKSNSPYKNFNWSQRLYSYVLFLKYSISLFLKNNKQRCAD